MQENPECNHPIDERIESLTKEVDELRVVVQFLASQLWELQDNQIQIPDLPQQRTLKETIQTNKFQLKLIRYALVCMVGVFSIFYAALAGTEISRTTEQGEVRIKGAEVLSGLSAIVGGVGVSVLGFGDRFNQRGNHLKNR